MSRLGFSTEPKWDEILNQPLPTRPTKRGGGGSFNFEAKSGRFNRGRKIGLGKVSSNYDGTQYCRIIYFGGNGKKTKRVGPNHFGNRRYFVRNRRDLSRHGGRVALARLKETLQRD